MAELECLDCSNIESLLHHFLRHDETVKGGWFPLFLKLDSETLKESQSRFQLLMIQIWIWWAFETLMKELDDNWVREEMKVRGSSEGN